MCYSFAPVMEKFREKIEKFGYLFEKHGMTPVASRIVFYLFLHPDGEATFEELVQYFRVSKSAVSNALKMLQLMEMIAVKTKSGVRKRYFTARLDYYFAPETVLKSYREMRLVLEELVALRRKDSVSDKLENIAGLIGMLEQEYPQLYTKWNERSGQ